MVQSHLDDLTDTVLVDLVHREGSDTMLLENLLLARIDITETNVNESFGRDVPIDPLVFGNIWVET